MILTILSDFFEGIDIVPATESLIGRDNNKNFPFGFRSGMPGNRGNLPETLSDFGENLQSRKCKRTTREHSFLRLLHLDGRDEFHRTGDFLGIRDRFDTGFDFFA